MELFSAELLNHLPLMAHVAGTVNPMLYAKFYLPDDLWHFYVSAVDRYGAHIYGYRGSLFDPCAEWMSYEIEALKRKRAWLGYPVKQDRSLICCHLSEIHPYLLC